MNGLNELVKEPKGEGEKPHHHPQGPQNQWWHPPKEDQGSRSQPQNCLLEKVWCLEIGGINWWEKLMEAR